MKSNRSIPNAAVIPVLTYPDVREAVDWLCVAFGFRERTFSESQADVAPEQWGGILQGQ